MLDSLFLEQGGTWCQYVSVWDPQMVCNQKKFGNH